MPKATEGLERRVLIQRPDVVTNLATQALSSVKGRQSFYQVASVAVLVMMDLASLAAAITLAFLIRVHILPVLAPVFPSGSLPDLAGWLWWALIIGLLCLAYEGLYNKRLPFWRETRRLVKSVTLAFLLILAIVSLGKINNEVSRTVLVLGYLISIILLPLSRLAVKTALARIGLWRQPVLILGAGKTGELVTHALLREKFLGYQIVGFLDDDPAKRIRGVLVNNVSFPVLGKFQESDRIMKQTGVRHLIVAAPGMPARRLVELVNRLQQQASSVTVIPDLLGITVMGVEADYSFDEKVLSFCIPNKLANKWNMLAKRLFDLVMGAFVAMVALPMVLIIAISIRLDSPGPAIFSHRRIGRGGKEFKCYKFRTMYLDNEEILRKYLEENPEAKHEWDKYAKLKGHDSRVTKVGRFLRKFSLDELPQIFDVLKGEMSLVGPRPYLPCESLRLVNYADTILLARPGITGLWQVSGRNEIDFEGRLHLDSWYVHNWSLWLDITLLIRTVGVVVAGRGAY